MALVTGKNYLRAVLIFAFLAGLAPHRADAACPESLARIWRGAAERTQRYYTRQLGPVAEDATTFQRTLTWVKRAGTLAFDVALAPALLALDFFGAATEVVTRAPAWENGRLNPLERATASLLSIIPTSLPHLALYGALTAGGINLPLAIEDATPSSYISDFESVMGAQLSLNRNEMIVLMAPALGTDKTLDAWVDHTQRAFAAQIPAGAPSPMRIIRESNARSALEKLADLRREGQIEQMVIAAHGSPGRVNLEARSLTDEVSRSLLSLLSRRGDGIIDANEILAAKIPADLFTSDARVMIAGCSAARGEKGAEFLQVCHAQLMQGRGVVAGTTNLLRLVARADSQKIEAMRRQMLTRPNLSSSDELRYYVNYHFIEAPLRMAAYDFFGLGTLYRNYAQPEQPGVVTYPPR